MDGPPRPTAERLHDVSLDPPPNRLRLPGGHGAVLAPAGRGWSPAGDLAGCSGALVRLLRDGGTPAGGRFGVTRLGPVPEASGERVLTDRSVAVGERVVVTWAETLADAPHPAPDLLEHLTVLRFPGLPDVHGLLWWTAPGGHRVPVAVVSRYLPGARDGVRAFAEQLGPAGSPPEHPPLAARVGRLLASLHCALASPSRVFPDPVASEGAGAATRWAGEISDHLDRAVLAAADAGHPWGPARTERLRLAVRELAQLPPPTGGFHVQRVHGDLTLRRVVRWPGGLAVRGFVGAVPPVLRGTVAGPQPPTRDVARVLDGLRRAATAAPRLPGRPDPVREWLPGARQDLLDAYRAGLAVARRPGLLQEALLPAFEAEAEALDAVLGDPPPA